MRSRLMTALYLLGKRRGLAAARRDLEDMASRFEGVNEATRDELRALRGEIARSMTQSQPSAMRHDG
jgi:hypothetical protein